VNDTLLPSLPQQPSCKAQFLTKHLFSISTGKYGFHFAKCKNKTPLDPFKGQSQLRHWGPFAPAPTPSLPRQAFAKRGEVAQRSLAMCFWHPGGPRLGKTSPDLSEAPCEESSGSLVQIRQPLQNTKADGVQLGMIQPPTARVSIATGAPLALSIHWPGKPVAAKRSPANAPMDPLQKHISIS